VTSRTVRQRQRRTTGRAVRALATLVSVGTMAMTLGPLAHAGASGHAAPTHFTNQAPRQIVASAMASATRLGSVTATSSTSIGGQDYSLVTLSATSSGQQSLRIGAATTVVRVLDGVVYIDDSATAIQAQFGVSAPHYANRWIEIPATSSYFAHFNTFIVLASLLSEIPPAGVLTVTRPSVVRRIAVVGVAGRANNHLGLASGIETLFVSMSAPHVPVQLVASDVVQGHRETFVINFADWGKRLNVTRPTPALPISATTLPK
jgi:hypothetical protein